MLNIKLLREQPQFVAERLAVKNFDAAEIIKSINDLDQKRRETQTELDSILAEQNTLARAIGSFMKEGKNPRLKRQNPKLQSLRRGQGNWTSRCSPILTR